MSESVKVAVRCRPMSNREVQQGCRNVITIDSLSKSCTLENRAGGGSGKVYQFDAAFGSDASTDSVYENVGSVIVEAVLEGYNGTVFAYGQTGCGKSFTMRGFIEKTLEHLFEATSTASSETRYLALLSYLEIYNEKLRDLLQDSDADNQQLTLKEDPTRGTYVAGGLREVTVKDAEECQKLFEQGDKRRIAAATKMNAVSSRSHAVMTLSLEAIAINDDEDDSGGDEKSSGIRRGRLHLVDLAGSERQTRTGATGDRLKEAASINLSLSALGNVISALAAGNGRHVPYRDSKLTRLLRDSLGGNARTLMIACVSPSDIDSEETLSTLRYAARARCIKNKPIVNEDPKDALLRQYQVELQRLRKLLESNESDLRQTLTPKENTDENSPDKLTEKQYIEKVEDLRRECENSNLSAQKLREELDALRARYESGLQTLNVNGKIANGKHVDDLDPEKEERRRRKREAAKQEVLKRLEKLTIGGEELDNMELKKRREKRRKRLETLAVALESSAQEGNGSVFQVYGQLRSTEDALKRMARRTKQLEVEAADLQASWDAERRELLRRELLTSQLCDAMIPYLRPGCPYRDIAAVRASASWCDELGRWRLPDFSPHIPLPPPSLQPRDNNVNPANAAMKHDVNNNSSGVVNGSAEGLADRNDVNGDTGSDAGDEADEDNMVHRFNNDENATSDMWKKTRDFVDTYFRRSRIDTLLAHAREAKTFEVGNRLSKSGGSEDALPLGNSYLQLNALNLQSSAPVSEETNIYRACQRPPPPRGIGAWLSETDTSQQIPSKGYNNSYVMALKKNPPRILEALPSYPQGGHVKNARMPFRAVDRTIRIDKTLAKTQNGEAMTKSHYELSHAHSPTY